MRQGYKNKFITIHSSKKAQNKGKEEILVGIDLGSDYCSEHEWGIKDIRKYFGMNDSGYGVNKRKISIIPNNFKWVKTSKFEGFGFSKYGCKIEEYPNLHIGSEGVWTGWSDRDFGAFSNKPEIISKLKEIFEAIKNLNACIWLGGGGVFENAGLVIAITDRIPKENLDDWYKADKEREQLLKDAKATGIAIRLEKANLRYFALSPRRAENGDVIFWLNPYEQDIHNSCWCTVKDLDDWIAGKGKIIKSAKEKAKCG